MNKETEDYLKAGIGDNDDLKPHIFNDIDEDYKQDLDVYLNANQLIEQTYYPEVKAQFRLWMEADIQSSHTEYYNLDIEGYPNLKVEYKLEKICHDYDTVDSEWDNTYTNSLSSMSIEGEKILRNDLNWDEEQVPIEDADGNIEWVTSENFSIKIIDNSTYTNYDHIKEDIKIEFEDGSIKSSYRQDIILINNFTLSKEDYEYDDLINYNGYITGHEKRSFNLPEMYDVTDTTKDILKDICVVIEENIEKELYVPDADEEQIVNLNPIILFQVIPLFSNDNIRKSFNKYLDDYMDITDYMNLDDYIDDKHIKDTELSRLNMPLNRSHNNHVENKMKDYVSKNFTVVHPINADDIYIKPDVLSVNNIAIGDTSRDIYYTKYGTSSLAQPTNIIYADQYEKEGHDLSGKFISEYKYFHTDMFDAQLNGTGYFNEQQDFEINFGMLTNKISDDSRFYNYLPIQLSDKNVSNYINANLEFPDNIDLDTIVIKIELVDARLKDEELNTIQSTDIGFNRLKSYATNQNSTIIISTDYITTDYFEEPWQSNGLTFTIEDIDKNNSYIIPAKYNFKDTDLINDKGDVIFNNKNIHEYWEIPENVFGPYTISYESQNEMIRNDIYYME